MQGRNHPELEKFKHSPSCSHNHSFSKDCSSKLSSPQQLLTTPSTPLWFISRSSVQLRQTPNPSQQNVSLLLADFQQSTRPASFTSNNIQQQLRHVPSSLPSDERKLLNLPTSTDSLTHHRLDSKGDSNKNWSPGHLVNDKTDSSSLKLLGIVIGVVSTSVIIFTGLIYSLHRYRRRNQGSYRIDGLRFSASYETASSSLTVNNMTSNNAKPLVHLNHKSSSSSTPGLRKGSRQSKSKTPLTSREWYVWRTNRWHLMILSEVTHSVIVFSNKLLLRNCKLVLLN